MIYRITREWRKVFILSATFLFAIFLMVACKKQITSVGSSGIDEAGLLAAGAIDTFTLETYSIYNDSLSTKNPPINVLGEMNDPVFGNIKASFYTQIRLNAASPNFGDIADIKMDSVVLAMQFSNYTGDLTKQTFEVYRLNELMDSSTSVAYYDFSTLDTQPGNLMDPAVGPIRPEPIANAIIDTVSVDPQLRLRLDTAFAKDLMIEAQVNPSSFSSNDNFLNYFNGLYITTNNASMASGKGGLFGFNMSTGASKLTLYYEKLEDVAGVPTWVKKSYDFVINSNSQSFNHVDTNRLGTKLDMLLNDKSKGLTEFYCQAFGVSAVINIPGLSNIPKNAVIQKAILNLPIQYQNGSIYSPGNAVSFFQKLTEESNSVQFLSGVSSVNYGSKNIVRDIGGYVQSIVSGLSENKPLYIYPSRFTTSGDRIIFNGPNTINKVKPKLYIIYSVF